MIKCDWCTKVKDEDSFELHVYRGKEKRKTTCKDCIPRRKEYMKKWRQTPKGVTCRQNTEARPENKATVKRYRQSEKGRATIKKNESKPARKAKRTAYWKTEKYKSIARKKRERFFSDSGKKLQHDIRCMLTKMLSGHCPNPKNLLKYVEFSSLDQIRAHFQSTLPEGTTMADYGTKWVVEHKVPVWCFDHTDIADVARCWSPQNLHAMAEEENLEKAYKIVDAYVQQVGTSHFPKLFQGVVPSEGVKKVWYGKLRKGVCVW